MKRRVIGIKKLGKYSNGVEIQYKITEIGLISYDCIHNENKLYDKQLTIEELYMLKCLYEKVISENYNEVTKNIENCFYKED